MKEKLGLRVLGDIMGWDDARATEEFRWLSLMARLKYDGYEDFLAGARFIESLVNWLQQFPFGDDRQDAYLFIRRVLIYVGPAEMSRLVESFYSDHVQRHLVRTVAQEYGVAPYHVWSAEQTATAYDKLLRRTLFIGLSEGAHLDLVRRANSGIIGNEQVLLATYVDKDKWDKLLKDLREDLKDSAATFRVVYLIDDFVGSGTTFLRKDKDSGNWKGKLRSFRQTVDGVLTSHFDSALTVCVHHYIANHRAIGVIQERERSARQELGDDNWFRDVIFSFGTILPSTVPIDHSPVGEAQGFLRLAKTYFDPDDPTVKNKHIDEGGTDASLGFSGCALPLVLEHNTPNNSVALLWADTPGNDGSDGMPQRHAMRPLFRRRQRHG
jgi:hypothetical protein